MLYGELPIVQSKNGGPELRGFPVSIKNPLKSALLRLPTDTEILARLKKNSTILQDLGRGRQSPPQVADTTEADLSLFNLLRLDKGEEFDPFEAAKAIALLTYANVSDVEPADGVYRITLDTYACRTIHTLQSPTERDMHDYNKSIMQRRQLGRGKEELKFRHDVAIKLYDACCQGVEGYAAEFTDPKSVPAHHKFAVALELESAISNLDPVLDPNS